MKHVQVPRGGRRLPARRTVVALALVACTTMMVLVGLAKRRWKIPSDSPLAVRALHQHLQMQADPDEIQTFVKWVTSVENGSTYIEFGSGGSTDLVLRHTSHMVVSVESTPAWSHKVAQNAQKMGLERRLQAMVVDIGPTKQAGAPSDRSYKAKWPLYSSMVQTVPHARVVFVDGRFRVACALKAILYLVDEPVIIIHDFWNREKYHAVLEFASVVENATTLAVLRPKSGIDRSRISQLIERYEYEPS